MVSPSLSTVVQSLCSNHSLLKYTSLSLALLECATLPIVVQRLGFLAWTRALRSKTDVKKLQEHPSGSRAKSISATQDR
jgi:hypothetical protein